VWTNDTDMIVYISLLYVLLYLSVCKPCGVWTNDRGHVVRDGCDSVMKLLTEGFIPVLHGDCVLDDSIGCSILSSDSILRVCTFGDFRHYTVCFNGIFRNFHSVTL